MCDPCTPAGAAVCTDAPPFHKTVSYTRSEEEKKACPKSSNYWDPGYGKKKLCLIERDDYRDALGAPVYGCNMANPNPSSYLFGQCRASVTDGDLGEWTEKPSSIPI